MIPSDFLQIFHKFFHIFTDLIQKRGGCVICMDYFKYSNLEYGRLVRFFEPIAEILTGKLHHLEWQGFRPENGFMFGFSFGGQLVSEAGRRFGSNKIKSIDSKQSILMLSIRRILYFPSNSILSYP